MTKTLFVSRARGPPLHFGNPLQKSVSGDNIAGNANYNTLAKGNRMAKEDFNWTDQNLARDAFNLINGAPADSDIRLAMDLITWIKRCRPREMLTIKDICRNGLDSFKDDPTKAERIADLMAKCNVFEKVYLVVRPFVPPK